MQSLKESVSFNTPLASLQSTESVSYTHLDVYKRQRLDDFYSSFLYKNPKYYELWEVVKLTLIVSHSNASVESGFSVNKCILTENEKEDSIVAQSIVYDALKYYGG